MAPPILLRTGSKGPQVESLQAALRDLGLFDASVDGIYGPGTQDAVAKFQGSEGLPTDGIVGPQTWTRIGVAMDARRSFEVDAAGPETKGGKASAGREKKQETLKAPSPASAGDQVHGGGVPRTLVEMVSEDPTLSLVERTDRHPAASELHDTGYSLLVSLSAKARDSGSGGGARRLSIDLFRPNEGELRADEPFAVWAKDRREMSALVSDGDPGRGRLPGFLLAGRGLLLDLAGQSGRRGGLSQALLDEHPQLFSTLPEVSSPADQSAEGRSGTSPLLAGFLADDLNRRDRLGLKREVDALCSVILARDVWPPLSIGLFGDWGVGKSFFIKEMMGRVQTLTDAAARAEVRRGEPGFEREPAFWSDVAQIRFNAWHYMDADLWASLVASIFEGLAEHVRRRSGQKGEIEQERDRLLEQMELARQAVRDLEDQRAAAELERAEADARLADIARELDRERQRLPELSMEQAARSLWEDIWTGDSGLRQTLDGLSFGDALAGAEGARRQAQLLQTDIGRTQAKLLSLVRDGSRSTRIGVLLLIILAGLLIGDWIRGDSEDLLRRLGADLAALVAWVGGLIAAAGVMLKDVGKRLDQVRAVYGRFVKERPEHLEAMKEQHARVQARIDELSSDEASSRAALEDAAARVALIEEKLADLKVGRRLFRFIEERVQSGEYKDRLGIIALVRRDFDQLSGLLVDQSERKRAAWRPVGENAGQEDAASPSGPLAEIDRIVLYIDDLDRCPPERVVEVMQAVHLLLAFRLFVVVVAVDSRWLLLSLEKGYPDFLVLDRDNAGDGGGSLARWASTPQSYLEKIFQIPLHIRPMSQSGFSALLEDLAGAVVEAKPEAAGQRVGAAAHTGTAAGGEPPAGPGAAPGGRSGAAGVDQSERGGGGETGDADATLPADLYPTDLELTRAEVDFMARFHSLIDTPRGLKRFVNTYRLLRISVPPEEQGGFHDPDRGEYRHALALLALLVGRSHEAGLIFQALMDHSGRKTWRLFVEGLVPSGGRGSEARLKNEAIGSIPAAEVPRWRQLTECLAGLESLSGETLAPFQRWAPRVARYAFYPIRLDRAADSDR